MNRLLENQNKIFTNTTKIDKEEIFDKKLLRKNLMDSNVNMGPKLGKNSKSKNTI